MYNFRPTSVFIFDNTINLYFDFLIILSLSAPPFTVDSQSVDLKFRSDFFYFPGRRYLPGPCNIHHTYIRSCQLRQCERGDPRKEPSVSTGGLSGRISMTVSAFVIAYYRLKNLLANNENILVLKNVLY